MKPRNISVNEDDNTSKKFNFLEVFSDDKINGELSTGGDCWNALDEIDPKWDSEVNKWLDTEQEVEGRQKDVDDWDMWAVYPRYIISDDRMDEILFEVICDFSKYDGDGMADIKDLVSEFIDKMQKEFDEADIDEIEDAGRCTWRGHYHTGGYYPDA